MKNNLRIPFASPQSGKLSQAQLQAYLRSEKNLELVSGYDRVTETAGVRHRTVPVASFQVTKEAWTVRQDDFQRLSWLTGGVSRGSDANRRTNETKASCKKGRMGL